MINYSIIDNEWKSVFFVLDILPALSHKPIVNVNVFRGLTYIHLAFDDLRYFSMKSEVTCYSIFQLHSSQP